MNSEGNQENLFEEYKNMEINLHRDLMNSCRKYINDLSIVSILGILDIVKQEAIELEKAAKRNIRYEEAHNSEDNYTDTIQ